MKTWFKKNLNKSRKERNKVWEDYGLSTNKKHMTAEAQIYKLKKDFHCESSDYPKAGSIWYKYPSGDYYVSTGLLLDEKLPEGCQDGQRFSTPMWIVEMTELFELVKEDNHKQEWLSDFKNAISMAITDGNGVEEDLQKEISDIIDNFTSDL